MATTARTAAENAGTWLEVLESLFEPVAGVIADRLECRVVGDGEQLAGIDGADDHVTGIVLVDDDVARQKRSEVEILLEALMCQPGIARAQNSVLTELLLEFRCERRLDVDIAEDAEPRVFECIDRHFDDVVKRPVDLLICCIGHTVQDHSDRDGCCGGSGSLERATTSGYWTTSLTTARQNQRLSRSVDNPRSMVTRRITRALLGLLGFVAVAGVAYALRWRQNPSPCPYARRRWIDLPRPVITRERLRDLLAPRSGERVLEVGSGTGYYTLPVAQSLEPAGAIHAVDVQRGMLEQLRTRATARGCGNVVPVHADGQTLPYPDDTFDAASLVLTLGEIPDQQQALAELHRVVKPGGRLVVGELLPDPHFVTRTTLRRRAGREGFEFDAFVGTRVGYFGRFHVPASPA